MVVQVFSVDATPIAERNRSENEEGGFSFRLAFRRFDKTPECVEERLAFLFGVSHVFYERIRRCLDLPFRPRKNLENKPLENGAGQEIALVFHFDRSEGDFDGAAQMAEGFREVHRTPSSFGVRGDTFDPVAERLKSTGIQKWGAHDSGQIQVVAEDHQIDMSRKEEHLKEDKPPDPRAMGCFLTPQFQYPSRREKQGGVV